MGREIVVRLAARKFPTPVDDACDTYPPVKVESPVTPRVLLKVAAPESVLAPETVRAPPVLTSVPMVDE